MASARNATGAGDSAGDHAGAARQPCEGAGSASFHRRAGELWCEDVAVAELARRFGTPLYVYSAAAIRERVADVRASSRHVRVLPVWVQ